MPEEMDFKIAYKLFVNSNATVILDNLVASLRKIKMVR